MSAVLLDIVLPVTMAVLVGFYVTRMDDGIPWPWAEKKVASHRLPYTDSWFTSKVYDYMTEVIKSPGGIHPGMTRKKFVEKFVETNDLRGEGTREDPYRFGYKSKAKGRWTLRGWWQEKVSR